MATSQTTKKMSRRDARIWLDEKGLVETRLPKRDEQLEILMPNYTQFDIIRDETFFYLTETKLVTK